MRRGLTFEAQSRSGQTYSTPSFFFEGLTLLFVALKLTGHIGWSWWWVLAPFWIPGTVALVFFVIVLVFILAGVRSLR